MFELFRAIERLYRKEVIHMQTKISITTIIDLLKALGRIWLAFMTEEHCRFCQRYIDQLGWIEKFYAKFGARNETLEIVDKQESTEGAFISGFRRLNCALPFSSGVRACCCLLIG